MIEVTNWIAHIPEDERRIAYVGENKTETRSFRLTDADRGLYAYYLDIAFDLSTVTSTTQRQQETTSENSQETVGTASSQSSSTKTKETARISETAVDWDTKTDVVPLASAEDGDGLTLTWTILAQHTQLPGTLQATLRGITADGRVRKSAIMTFEVEPAVMAVAAKPPVLSEEEQLIARMESAYAKYVSKAAESETALEEYVNSAAAFNTSAGAQATAAANNAQVADDARRAAEAAQKTAEAAATTAAEKAETLTGSAAAAASSADDAAASAAAAAASATTATEKAAAAEQNAAVSASNAETAYQKAQAAASSAGDAATAKTAAEASVYSAQSFASNAQTARDVAAQKAQSAETAADTATEKAAAAEASATAAASSATAAAASAAQAAQQALVVNFTAAGGTSLTADKTFEEVKAALDANRVVIAYRGNTGYTVDTVYSNSVRFFRPEMASGGGGKYEIYVRYINFSPTYAYFSMGNSGYFYTADQTDATFATKTALNEGIENAAAAGRMEVIYSTTLTEEVNDITVSALPGGESFSLDRVAIYMKLPSSITVKINELTVWFNEQTNSNRVYMQTSQVGCRHFYFIGERIGNDDIHVWDCCASIAAAAANMANQRRLISLGAASSILINSVTNLPVGTQVLICGRKVSQ